MVQKPKGRLVLLLQLNQTLMFKARVSDCRGHKLAVLVHLPLTLGEGALRSHSAPSSQLQGSSDWRSLLVRLDPRSGLGSYAEYQISGELRSLSLQKKKKKG